MSCGIGHRHSWDLAWLWLWRRLVATAPIGPLAWEPLYAMGAAQENGKKTKNKTKQKNKKNLLILIRSHFSIFFALEGGFKIFSVF